MQKHTVRQETAALWKGHYLWFSIGAAGLLHNPDNPRIWNTVGVVYFNESDYISASEAFEHAITLNPYYYDAMFNLRDTYEELGNKAGYEECAERLKNLKPGDEQ